MADPSVAQTESKEQGDDHKLQNKYQNLFKTAPSNSGHLPSESSDSSISDTNSQPDLSSSIASESPEASTESKDEAPESTEAGPVDSPSMQPVRQLGFGLPSGQRGPKSSPARKTLPLQPGKRKPAKDEEVKNPDTLLVEDVRVSQKIAQMALQRTKRKVDIASSGEEAVEKFKKHVKSLNLVLMDIMLPGISGIEATKEIRQFETKNTSKRTVILGLTGCVSEKDLKKYKEADMDGCIAKGELLATAVNDALIALKTKPDEFVVLTEVRGKKHDVN